MPSPSPRIFPCRTGKRSWPFTDELVRVRAPRSEIWIFIIRTSKWALGGPIASIFNSFGYKILGDFGLLLLIDDQPPPLPPFVSSTSLQKECQETGESAGLPRAWRMAFGAGTKEKDLYEDASLVVVPTITAY